MEKNEKKIVSKTGSSLKWAYGKNQHYCSGYGIHKKVLLEWVNFAKQNPWNGCCTDTRKECHTEKHDHCKVVFSTNNVFRRIYGMFIKWTPSSRKNIECIESFKITKIYASIVNKFLKYNMLPNAKQLVPVPMSEKKINFRLPTTLMIPMQTMFASNPINPTTTWDEQICKKSVLKLQIK